jgi:hypothetical protein
MAPLGLGLREHISGATPEVAEDGKLDTLLNETRILLPGTQVFLGFLATVPFNARFVDLDETRRVVYLWTFLATLLSLVLFVVPAAYHRIARPIRHKARFKVFANRFLVAGLVPMSISMVLATYLVAYVALPQFAPMAAGGMLVVIALVWWVVPLIRAHDIGNGRTEPNLHPDEAQAGFERDRAKPGRNQVA